MSLNKLSDKEHWKKCQTGVVWLSRIKSRGKDPNLAWSGQQQDWTTYERKIDATLQLWDLKMLICIEKEASEPILQGTTKTVDEAPWVNQAFVMVHQILLMSTPETLQHLIRNVEIGDPFTVWRTLQQHFGNISRASKQELKIRLYTVQYC